jgi:acetoacetate decarboxylase
MPVTPSLLMNSYFHFLTPSGKSSVVQGPPYHYGADFITIYFRSDPEKLQYFLPDPLKVLDGSAIAYVSDFVCTVSENDLNAPYEDPAQATYHEAAVGVRCTYKGNPGIYYPFMWVDRDWSLVRGWSLGYSKKLADDIHMTRLYKYIPKVSYYGPGAKLSGYCSRHGSRILSVSLEITRKGTPQDLMSSPSVYALRYFPVNAEGQNKINELVEIQKGNSQLGEEIWYGKGEVHFFDSRNEEVIKIDPITTVYGLAYQFGFTNYGSKVLQ